MSWIDTNEYDENDVCTICHENYGTTQAIYKTICNHKFHNNCLNDYCEHKNGDILCPVCRADIDYACMDVWAFKNKALGNTSGAPLFNGNEHITSIYNNQTETSGGRRYRKKQTKRRKRSKRTKKVLSKNKKSKKRAIK
jgi:hypothetical protein